MFGVALATKMVFVGMAAAITRLKQSTADGFGDAVRAFTIIPVSGLIFFVALFTLALLKVRQPLLSDLLIVAAMVHDRKTTGRVHPVYWIAGGALVALQVLRVPLSTTAAWTQIANWLLTISV